MQHQTTRGRLAYLGPGGVERGREWFHITRAVDGTRTMRTVSEIDDSKILRDVTLTVDSGWRPVDCFVRVSVSDELLGTAWFRFGDSKATVEHESAQLGSVKQELTVSGRAPMFGAHQVMGDGWQAGLLASEDSGPTRVDGILLSSILPNGSSAPMLATTSMVAERIGPERIEVRAGEFDTVHYRFSPDGLVEEDIWVLPDDFTLVRSVWGHYGTTYELDELYN